MCVETGQCTRLSLSLLKGGELVCAVCGEEVMWQHTHVFPSPS